MSEPWFEIDCGPKVVALQTTCDPEPAPYGSFNLGLHVGDNEASVLRNHEHLASRFGCGVYFPEQVHGIKVAHVNRESSVTSADAVVTDQPNCPIGVMTADCLPVLFATQGLVGAATQVGEGSSLECLRISFENFLIRVGCRCGSAPASVQMPLKLARMLWTLLCLKIWLGLVISRQAMALIVHLLISGASLQIFLKILVS